MSPPTRSFYNGLSFYLHHLSESAQAEEHYEPEQAEIFVSLIKSIAENGCFVNVGASIGFYPLLAKRTSPTLQVFAFEPLKKHRDFFLENIALNGFRLSDFTLFEEGVSRSEGHIDYFENGFGSTIISKREATIRQRLKQVRLKIRRWLTETGIKQYPLSITRINTVSLETVVKRCGGEIDLLQTDVQGSEGDILIGGKHLLESGCIKRLMISTHGASMHVRCKTLLKEAGYFTSHDDQQEKHDGLLVCHHPAVRRNSVKLTEQRKVADGGEVLQFRRVA